MIIFVTGFEKTQHIVQARIWRNARLLYLRSKIVKVQFLSYSCQKTFLLTFAVAYGG